MKKFTYLAAIAMIAFTSNAVAQEASTTTSATVIAPISIASGATLNFGDIVGTTAGGTVTVSTTGARTSSATDLLIPTEGTVQAGTFTVSGQDGYTYTITLPSASFDVSDGATTASTMSVGSFFARPAGAAADGLEGTLGSGTTAGEEVVSIGATLTVGANQTPGVYTNDTGLKVTVAYN